MLTDAYESWRKARVLLYTSIDGGALLTTEAMAETVRRARSRRVANNIEDAILSEPGRFEAGKGSSGVVNG
jgi:hypothetical protein